MGKKCNCKNASGCGFDVSEVLADYRNGLNATRQSQLGAQRFANLFGSGISKPKPSQTQDTRNALLSFGEMPRSDSDPFGSDSGVDLFDKAPEESPSAPDTEVEEDNPPPQTNQPPGESASCPDTRRTREFRNFLTRLDNHQEAIADESFSRPFCAVPGCDQASTIHCDDCMGFFCQDHHIDEFGTHTTYVWNEELNVCRNTVELPGFQRSPSNGDVLTTPSFCR